LIALRGLASRAWLGCHRRVTMKKIALRENKIPQLVL
jgi:hypothetical protein